jgi:hypothetical protein
MNDKEKITCLGSIDKKTEFFLTVCKSRKGKIFMFSQFRNYVICILCVMICSEYFLFAHEEKFFINLKDQNNHHIPKSLFTVISVNLNEVPFEQALSTIAEKGNFKLNYNRNRIPVDKKISVKMDNVAAVKVLLKILNDTETGLKITQEGLLAIIPSTKSEGEIKGSVVEKKSGKPLAGANVVIVEKTLGAATGPDGHFLISKLPMGVYTIEASMIGFKSKRIENIVITENAAVKLHIELTDTLLSLREIIVTPGHYSLMEKEPTSAKALKAEDIRSFPQLGEDVFRAISRLPGVAGNDVSAKFTVRGGEHDEVLVLLDGMELYDPFHLKDLDGFLSIIDVEAINNIDMITGAFPAEYGNRLSGVFNMKTVNPSKENQKTSVAISFLNARFLSEGTFDSGKGQWLFLARRGYLDLLLKYLNPEDVFEPVYYDILAKVQYSFNQRHILSAHFLLADDDILMIETDDNAEFHTNYGNIYGWLTWYSQFFPGLTTQTILSKGKVNQNMSVEENAELISNFSGAAKLERGFDFYGFKQDWTYDLNENCLLKWGLDFKRFSARYDFFFNINEIITDENGNEISTFDTTQSNIKPDGYQFDSYLAARFRLSENLTAELGVRNDYANWTNESEINPRINFVYDLSKQTGIRVGWGKFYQRQGIHQLNAVDGDEHYYPAELAEHRIVGLEHEFKNGINLRVEAYQKKLFSIQPRYQNYKGFTLNPFAEIHPDRYRVEPEKGESRGFEIYLKNDSGNQFSWWASYSYAKAEDVINGTKILRDFDQRHTIYFDLNYHPNEKWRLNLSWQYHSGWPYTESKINIINHWPDGTIDYEWIPGPLNARRLPAYHRMDIRVARVFYTSHGRISTFFEIRNLYNRENIREYIYEYRGYQNGEYIVKLTGAEYLLPMLPSFGISWEF